MKKNLHFLFLLLSFFLLLACNGRKSSEERDAVVVSDELSNHRVLTIAQDSSGYIWMGTYRGLNRYDGNEMHQYFCTDTEGSLPDNMIRALHCDSKGHLWVGTKNGVCRYNEKDQFDPVPMPSSVNKLVLHFAESSRGDMYLLMTDRVARYDSASQRFATFIDKVPFLGYNSNNLYFDSEDNLWIVNTKGVLCYSTVTKRKLESLDLDGVGISASCMHGNTLYIAIQGHGIRAYDVIRHQWIENPWLDHEVSRVLGSALVTSIFAKDGKGRLLIGTTDGMFELWPDEHRIISQISEDFPLEAPDFNVSGIFLDRDKNIWLTSSSKGYAVRSVTTHVFDDADFINRQISNSSVNSVALQGKGTLWFTIMEKGLYRYSLSTHKLHLFSNKELCRFLPDSNSLPYYVFIDSRGRLWVSYVPGYVMCLQPVGDTLQKVDCYNIFAAIVIKEATDHTIWIGSYGNNYYTISPSDGKCTEHHFGSGVQSFLAGICLLKDGRLGAVTKGDALHIMKPGSQELSKGVIPQRVLKKNLNHGIFIPTSLYQDHKGRLWMGTVSNGLLEYDLKTGELVRYSDTPCEDIASIEEDNSGNIWVSSQNGIGKLDMKTGKFVNYYRGDGLNGNEFYDRCSVKLPDGRLVFGGEHGLTAFIPNKVQYNKVESLKLNDLRINNQLVLPGEDSPISECLSEAQEINLDYDQNSFSISYSTQDYCHTQHYSYQYSLEGLSHEWVDAKQAHEAFFSNIPAGSYTFSVRIMSEDRQHVLAECSIPVNVSTAPWLSWWAKIIYLLVIIAIATYWYKSHRRVREEKLRRMEIEHEKEQEKRINKMNMSFFANVSHEFRTPLTLISAPIIQLAADKSLPASARNILLVVQHSVERMMRLVNQMMDFHRLEDDALRLEVQHTDVTRLLKDIVASFQLRTEVKHQTLSATGLEEPLVSWVDTDKVEKMVYNLLGNAIKYTPSNGHIELSFDVIGDNMQICVSDNGPGIPSSDLDKIFERYYQVAKNDNGSFHWGTGIGLYYCKRLALLHHGSIKVENRTGDSTGAIFTILLPMGDEIYSNDLHLSFDAVQQTTAFPIASTALGMGADATADATDAEKPVIAVVDDDEDIVAYLTLLLQKDYNLIKCYDADTALSAIRSNEPDIILSDVVMPDKDGYTLCREIKEDLQICHIPVILVTAKTTTSDQIEGLGCGADSYVTKPFNPEYLLKLISSTLSNRQKVRRLLSEKTQVDDSIKEENILNAQDTAFMKELYSIMEKELSNPEIDINHITDIMHVSRTKLYYKIKGLTGEKPGNFFRLYKLNRAAELIREGNYNVSEIADKTGFSSPSYFSTCFKKQFGVSPRDFPS